MRFELGFKRLEALEKGMWERACLVDSINKGTMGVEWGEMIRSFLCLDH